MGSTQSSQHGDTVCDPRTGVCRPVGKRKSAKVAPTPHQETYYAPVWLERAAHPDTATLRTLAWRPIIPFVVPPSGPLATRSMKAPIIQPGVRDVPRYAPYPMKGDGR